MTYNVFSGTLNPTQSINRYIEIALEDRILRTVCKNTVWKY